MLCNNTAAYDGTAGSPPGSFAVNSEITLNPLGLFKGELTAESPAFTATGSGSGTLSLARQFSPGGLLNLGGQFTYTANLVDKTTNTKQKAITETVEGESPFTAKSGGVSLTAGHSYVIQIETTTSSTVAAVTLLTTGASGHFDNVVVTGPGGSENPGNGENGSDGGNGGEGGKGSNGSGGVSSAKLESLLQSSLIGPATMHGTKLSAKVKCPAKMSAACNVALQAMFTHRKSVSATRRAKVKPGKTKKFVLQIKPAARAKVRTLNKMLFRETVKVGAAKATVWKTLKLVRK